jgi:hypothetical protein
MTMQEEEKKQRQQQQKEEEEEEEAAAAALRRSAEKRSEALALFAHAQAIACREFGRDTPQVARQLEHQGLAHFLGGDFSQAERCFRDAHDTLLRSSGRPVRTHGGGGGGGGGGRSGLSGGDSGGGSDLVPGQEEGKEREEGVRQLQPLVGRFDPAIMRICNNMAIAQCCRGPSVF